MNYRGRENISSHDDSDAQISMIIYYSYASAETLLMHTDIFMSMQACDNLRLLLDRNSDS